MLDWNQTENRGNISYVDDYRADKEHEILEKILLSAIHGGISHKQLAKEVRLNERTLRRYIKRLKEKGLVKKGNKLQDKYLPAIELHKGPISKAYLLGDGFRRKVLPSNKFLVTNEDKSVFFSGHCIDFTIYKRYFVPRFTETDLLERILFEFSNRVGAYIIYAMMWSMDPDNNMSSPEQMDELVKALVIKSVSRVLPFLVWQFRDSVYRGINQYPSGYEAQVEYMKKNPSLIFSRDIIRQLKRSILRLYPRVYFELQSITDNLSEELRSEKGVIKDLEEELNAQNLCVHEYYYPEVIPDNSPHYYKKCSMCGLKKRVKKSECQKVLRDRNKKERNENFEPYSL